MSLSLMDAIREDRLNEFIAREGAQRIETGSYALTSSKQKKQSDKFKEAARELGVDLDEDQLRRTLGKLATVKEAEKPEDEKLKD